MSAEHEQLCERTIASVVHEIDDLKRQLQSVRDLADAWDGGPEHSNRFYVESLRAALETP